MALTEQQVAQGLVYEEPKVNKAQARADRRQAYVEADPNLKEEIKATQELMTSAKLAAIADEIKVEAAEVRRMYESGVKQLGESFSVLVEKHLEIAMGEGREANQERRFLIKLFADLRPDMAMEASANELMMAAGRKALDSGKIKLVRDTVEISHESPEQEFIGAAEASIPEHG